MEISQKDVLRALSYVNDPDLNKDLVTLNMVRDIEVSDHHVAFTIVLTTPACPLKEAIRQACINAIHHFIDRHLEVNITMSSVVTSLRNDNKQLLPGVKNIVAVASGKGGVGKSTVAVNLAIGLAHTGALVGLLDADIYGPSVPTMLGIKGMRPQVKDVNGKAIMEPVEKFGIKALSIGLLVDEKQAVVWRGPMASSALRQFVTDCDWGTLDYLIIDLPPGTGDIHLTLVQTVPVTGAVIVTTPQEVALADAKKAIGMFHTQLIQVPIIGIIENMAYYSVPDAGEENMPERHYIFGKEGGKNLATEFNVPFLGEIPLIESIRQGGDDGVPVVTTKTGGQPTAAAAVYEELARQVARNIAIRNANFEATRVVEMVR